MNIVKKPIFHSLLLIGAFLFALAVRLIRLGALSLTNLEANIALQALSISQHLDVVFGEHIAYVGLTGLDFFVFNPSNFLARFWPAIFGAMIVFIPFLFRDQIGKWPASILSFVLAISPEMVSLSRLVGTPMIAFVCLLMTFGYIIRGKPILSGILFAVALMSGSGFWTGIFLIGFVFLLTRLILGKRAILPAFDVTIKERKFQRYFAFAFILTIALVGTGFSFSPAGLSGVFSGLINFLHGFKASYTRPFFLRPLALLAYSLPAIIFGLWGGIRAFLLRIKFDMSLFILGILGLLYILLYPGATPADIIWVTLPFWTLAVRVAFFAWRLPEDNWLVMVITGLFVVIIFVFLLLSMRSLISSAYVQEAQLVTYIAIFGGVVLLAALILLVTYGWSNRIAVSGLLMGLAIVILLSLVSITFRTTSLSTGETFELWYPDEPQLSTRWLKISIDRVLEWNKRRIDPLEIVVVDLDTAGMRWALKEYDEVVFVAYPPPESQPAILISDTFTQPEISNSYRGQDLVWSQNALWEEMLDVQYLNWIITRDPPTKNDEIILWVRTDLMPDEQFTE